MPTEFSPMEKSILEVAGGDWQSASALAAKTGQKVGHCFYAILGNLVDREYLESSRNGYRLPVEGERVQELQQQKVHAADTEQAFWLLALVLAAGQPLHVKVEHGGHVAELTVRPAAVPPAPELAAPEMISGVADAILTVLRDTDKPLKAISIANRGKILYNAYFRKIIKHLVDAGRVIHIQEDHRYWLAERGQPPSV